VGLAFSLTREFGCGPCSRSYRRSQSCGFGQRPLVGHAYRPIRGRRPFQRRWRPRPKSSPSLDLNDFADEAPYRRYSHTGHTMVSTDHYRQGLLAQMGRAAAGGRIDVLINCVELHRSLGGYPTAMLEMQSCCDAMQAEMKPGDITLVERTNGFGMTVRYLLPRVATSP
jgi:hypothetical protein